MGLKDCLDSDVKVSKTKGLGSKMKQGLIGTLAVGSMLFSSGCSTYGNNVARNLAYTGMQQTVVSNVRNSIECRSGTTVNVGRDKSPQNSSRFSLEVWKYKDFNNNGKPDMNTENLGLINDNDSINLDKVGIAISLSTSSFSNKTDYYIVDSDYNRLAVITRMPVNKKMYASGSLASNSFMEVFNNLDAGDYTLHANSFGLEFSKKITIVRDSFAKSTTDSSK